MDIRVSIAWTGTAKEGFKEFPKKVRAGFLKKIEALYDADPRRAHKPLVGPLQGYYRIALNRYRVIYSARGEKIASGDVLVHVHVCFVVAGIRKEGDKKDVYELAKRLINLGIIPAQAAQAKEYDKSEAKNHSD